jgi:hypothetical protein
MYLVLLLGCAFHTPYSYSWPQSYRQECARINHTGEREFHILPVCKFLHRKKEHLCWLVSFRPVYYRFNHHAFNLKHMYSLESSVWSVYEPTCQRKYRLHLRGKKSAEQETSVIVGGQPDFRPWGRFINGLHGAISQKVATFMNTAVKTSNHANT